jgi:hypothetical protein
VIRFRIIGWTSQWDESEWVDGMDRDGLMSKRVGSNVEFFFSKFKNNSNKLLKILKIKNNY